MCSEISNNEKEVLEKLQQTIEDINSNESELKSFLHEMALVYIKSEQIDSASKEERENIAFQFYLLDGLITDVSSCQSILSK